MWNKKIHKKYLSDENYAFYFKILLKQGNAYVRLGMIQEAPNARAPPGGYTLHLLVKSNRTPWLLPG